MSRSAILKPYSLRSFVLIFEQRESDLIGALRLQVALQGDMSADAPSALVLRWYADAHRCPARSPFLRFARAWPATNRTPSSAPPAATCACSRICLAFRAPSPCPREGARVMDRSSSANGIGGCFDTFICFQFQPALTESRCPLCP